MIFIDRAASKNDTMSSKLLHRHKGKLQNDIKPE